MPHRPTLTALYRYPIKSCAGTALERAQLDGYGIVGDRRWMVVDADGRFMTQRQHPALARVRPTLSAATLELTAPAMEPLSIPLHPSEPTVRTVQVWNDACTVEDAGDAAAAWLSDYLQVPCRLVKMGAAYERTVRASHAQSDADRVSFADGFPFLLTSEASLDELNRRLDAPVPMDRFRPNLVIAGAEPFEEDRWKIVRIGDVTFHVAKPCARCVVTTTDQTTGERGTEPLSTLASFRRDRNGNVCFGQNLIHAPKRGEIAVGDAVTILEAASSGPSRQAG